MYASMSGGDFVAPRGVKMIQSTIEIVAETVRQLVHSSPAWLQLKQHQREIARF